MKISLYIDDDDVTIWKAHFAHVSQTFCSDSQVADSACSATAYLSGTKANIATIGVKPTVGFRDCKHMMNVSHQVESVLAWAQVSYNDDFSNVQFRNPYFTSCFFVSSLKKQNW